jgi:hypothetical protein
MAKLTKKQKTAAVAAAALAAAVALKFKPRGRRWT